MGLDQYAHKVKSDYNNETCTETIVKTELQYWRKHNRLQGWMENLWVIKTGKKPGELNCRQLELDGNDLNLLHDALVNERLPETEGFFYGVDSYERDTLEYDMRFVDLAFKAIKDGYQVFYSCSW